jgi:predicted phosphodiesterase
MASEDVALSLFISSSMLYGIFSDIHSNLEALNAVIDAFKKEDVDTYLCVGDLVGYAANPNECIEKTSGLTNIIVAGNHDWAAVNLFSVEYFSPLAGAAISWTKRALNDRSRPLLESLKLVYKNQDLTLVHGTLDNPADFNYLVDGYTAEKTFTLLDTNVCFVGHSHIAGIFLKDKDGQIHYSKDNSSYISPENKYIVNVGSVGQPRDNNPKACYCVYDTDKKEVRIQRADYDIKTTRKEIMDAGLPKFLGDRLLLGR